MDESERPPAGACDCHAHVYGPPERYMLRPGRRYTPPTKYFADYQQMLQRIRVDRAVVVQPTVYANNDVTRDALVASAGKWRGVAKFAEGEVSADFGAMQRDGFRGVRVHGIGASSELAKLGDIARMIAPFGWHIQLHMESRLLPDLEATLRDLPVPVVFDHFARIQPEEGTDAPPMRTLLRLLETGRFWMKLSGSYLVSRQPYPYADLQPFAEAYVATRPDRMLWGTDWPHPSHEGPPLDDAIFYKLLRGWVKDSQVLHDILVGNPAQLYGF
jgi:predicted TIM-barrel fold metal-dependent hydrolase